jgi:benzodiazapine receptor
VLFADLILTAAVINYGFHNGHTSMSTYSKQRQLAGLAGWLLLCFAVSFIGALGSFQAPDIYAQFQQPDWAPPAWLFGPVWTTLYTLMAVAAWLVWRDGGWQKQAAALNWFLAQLALNALWSWLFFAWLQGLGSFIEIMLLWLVILITLRHFWPVNRLAAWLLVPYVLWVSFAAVLNLTLWQLNTGIL